MPSNSRAFCYRDAHGKISARSVSDVSESEVYIQGRCEDSGQLRTFRKDRILEHLPADAADGFITERLEVHREAHPSPDGRASPKKAPPGTMEVCFTGFKAAEKSELITLAKESGFFFVRPSITKKLHFLCCGDNAGPAKVRKARAQGVIALSADEFRTLAETGEVPDG